MSGAADPLEGLRGGALARRALLLLLALAGLAALWVAITVPLHETDALLFGVWSREIAQSGGFHYADLSAVYLQRPLFFLAQGWLWNVFGEHAWIGRLLSLAFGAGLVVCVVRLADAATSARRWSLGGALAGVLMLACPDVVRFGFAGLSDVPAAALVAVAAVVLWTGAPARWRPPLVVVLAALATLAKPSALAAIAGLGLAHLIGPRAELRTRLLGGLLPLAAGGVIGLAYDATQAHYVHTSLLEFLRAGTQGGFAELSDQTRAGQALGLAWLGPYLVAPLTFAVAYAATRVAGLAHRPAAIVAAVAGIAGSIALPALGTAAGYDPGGPFAGGQPAAAAATVALWLALALAPSCPPEHAPSRAQLARLLVWAALPVAAWVVGAPYYTRLAAPAWPALFVLMAVALVPVVLGVARRLPAAGVLVLAVIALMGIADLRNLDSLGARPDGSISAVRAARELGVTGWLHPSRTFAAADEALAGELAAARAATGPRGTLFTADSRLRFSFGERMTGGEPERCAQLRGFDAFVLITAAAATSEGSRPGPSAGVAFWLACRSPKLRLVAQQAGAYAVFAPAR